MARPSTSTDTPIQPELPLGRPGPASADQHSSPGGSEWRLDEETRRRGQLGIAAARAAHQDAAQDRHEQGSGNRPGILMSSCQDPQHRHECDRRSAVI